MCWHLRGPTDDLYASWSTGDAMMTESEDEAGDGDDVIKPGGANSDIINQRLSQPVIPPTDVIDLTSD